MMGVGFLLSYAVVTAILLFFVAMLVLTALIYQTRRKYRHIPSTKCSFYFGHSTLFADCFKEDSVKFLNGVIFDMQQETGSPVFVVYFFHKAVVFIHEPNAIKEIILDNRHPKNKDVYKNFSHLYGARFTGRGLLTEFDYDQWHKRRVILNASFNRKFLKNFMDPFNASTDLFLNKLSEKADGKSPVCMVDHLNRVTLDVIAKVAFGLDLGIIENEDSFFNTAVKQALDGVIMAGDPLFSLPFRNREFKSKARSAVNTIREVGRDCLSKRIDDMSSGKEVPDDILSYIIKARTEVEGDDREKLEVMLDEFTLFFFAGQETTGNLLTFVIMELGKNPEILHRLKTEVDSVIGDTQYVNYENVNQLSYMTQVVKETLRLWPPVGGMGRELAFEVTAAGYRIPAGSDVQFSSFIITRLDKYFPNALEFDPDRFSNEADMVSYTYFPFAFGSKSCIGQHFAMIETRVILARFLQRFQFELVPGQSFAIKQRITSQPKGGCMVYLKERLTE